jgi:uncharacterized protein
MSLLETAGTNLLSPPILFFMLGALAALLKSDLEIPAPIGKALSLYLMAAIGFKGGLSLAKGADASMLALLATAFLLSLLMPLVAFGLLRRTTRLGVIDAAAIAAHYGSVSVVTFVTATAFLQQQEILFSGALVAALALMESPAIVSGLLLARRDGAKGPLMKALKEAAVNGSILLLVGALAIGWATGERGEASLGPVLIVPFTGVLAFFLLDMGLIAAQRLKSFSAGGWSLVAFGLYMPLLGATFGLVAAKALGLSMGDGTLLAVLAASASYIAVPAALRHALPQANPSLYVPLSLGVTFPFNILIGIPLYHAAAKYWLG